MDETDLKKIRSLAISVHSRYSKSLFIHSIDDLYHEGIMTYLKQKKKGACLNWNYVSRRILGSMLDLLRLEYKGTKYLHLKGQSVEKISMSATDEYDQIDVNDPENLLIGFERNLRLRCMLESHEILMLYYVGGESMLKVGKRLNYSEASICVKHKELIKRLRTVDI